MKLFYIANSRIPSEKANSIQIVKMAESFTRLLGEDFTLVLPKRIQPAILNSISIKDYYSLDRNLPIKTIGLPIDPLVLDNYFGLFLNGLPYRVQVILFGIAVLIFSFRNRYGSIFYTRDFYTLLFIKLAGAKVYYEAHYFPKVTAIKWLHRIVLPRIEGVVAITGCFKDFFKKNNIHFRKIMTAHDATDPSFFKRYSKAELKKKRREVTSTSETIIGYIGNLNGLGEDKGGSDLVKAFDIVRRKYKQVKLVVVGAGNIAEHKDIYTTGRIRYSEMPLWHNLIDIAVIPFPNRTHFKFFMSPLKLFDYLACGKPIVTSDFTSLREVINESNAVFVTASNAKSLAGGIERLLINKKLQLELSHNNKILANKYTWTKRARAILNYL